MPVAPTDVRTRLAALTRADPETGCLVWTASTNSMGYGRITNEHGGTELAHRVAWRTSGRTLVPGMDLDHVRERCAHRPLCVNVDHLEQVTHRENVLRGDAPSAIAHREQRCMQGHDMTAEHGSRGPNGKWRCNTCRQEKRRARPRLIEPTTYCACGTALVQPATGRKRVWCSRSCRERRSPVVR